MAEKFNQCRRKNKENDGGNQSPENQTRSENPTSSRMLRQDVGSPAGQESGLTIIRLQVSADQQLMNEGDRLDQGKRGCKNQKGTAVTVKSSREQKLEARKQKEEGNSRETKEFGAKIEGGNGSDIREKIDKETGENQKGAQCENPQLAQNDLVAQIAAEVIERDRGPQTNKLKSKKRKWKIQAGSGEQSGDKRKGPTITKRPVSKVNLESPEAKKRKMDSQITGIHIMSPKAKQMLKGEYEKQQDVGRMDMAVENMEKNQRRLVTSPADNHENRQLERSGFGE